MLYVCHNKYKMFRIRNLPELCVKTSQYTSIYNLNRHSTNHNFVFPRIRWVRVYLVTYWFFVTPKINSDRNGHKLSIILSINFIFRIPDHCSIFIQTGVHSIPQQDGNSGLVDSALKVSQGCLISLAISLSWFDIRLAWVPGHSGTAGNCNVLRKKALLSQSNQTGSVFRWSCLSIELLALSEVYLIAITGVLTGYCIRSQSVRLPVSNFY